MSCRILLTLPAWKHVKRFILKSTESLVPTRDNALVPHFGCAWGLDGLHCCPVPEIVVLVYY
jgi:hypothetical protein